MGPDLKEKKAMLRPNSWGFDLHSVASSGYCSAENSTESEYPPFDWECVRDKLEGLENLEVVVEAPKARQYMMNDCFFTVYLKSTQPLTKVQSCLRTLEVCVTGPSGSQYEVVQNPGKTPAEVICTFRPLECGPHTCSVMLLHSQSNDPAPFTIDISRRYGDSEPITSVDIELPESDNENTFQARKPWGICASKRTEEVFVADRERHEILVYGPDGELKRKFGEEGHQINQFYRPTAVAYDEVRDRILVADKDNHRIQVFTTEGVYIMHFGRRGNYPGQFFFPWGIAVSRDGKYIAVADSRNHRIQLFDHAGKFLRKYSAVDRNSTSYKKEFDYPRGVCFDLAGDNIYVTDFNLHALFRLSVDMNSCERILDSDSLKRPQGVAVDDSGNILVCDSRHNSVKVVSKQGEIIGELRRVGKKSAVELPLDIDVSRGGYVTLLDMNGRVRIF